MISLQDILEIENDEEILQFRCPKTGYLLWPFIRNFFIRFIMSDTLYETPLIPEQNPRRPWMFYVSTLRSFVHNALGWRDLSGEILISTAGKHVLRDGRYFNRVTDDFMLAAPHHTVVMEGLFPDGHWPFPRYERVFFDAPF